MTGRDKEQELEGRGAGSHCSQLTPGRLHADVFRHDGIFQLRAIVVLCKMDNLLKERGYQAAER